MISDSVTTTLINNKEQSAESYYGFLIFVDMKVKSIMINTT